MALKAHLDPSPAQIANPAQIEGRRQVRRALRLETSGVLPDGVEANVTIHNISAAGLLLQTDLILGVGEVLAIDLPNVGPVGAEIVWQSDDLFGCAFQQALGEADLAAAQLRGDAGQAPMTTPHGSTGPTGFSSHDTLGTKLNRMRRERGLTLAQVATALGVSKPTVWAWEKGKARPLPERLNAIAGVLGVNEEELLDDGPRGEGAALVADCRTRIATAYGTEPDNIRIMIEI